MKLILISDNGSHHKKISISKRSAALLLLILSVSLLVLFAAFNYFKSDVITHNEIQLLNKFDAMLLKTAQLEGQVKRLNSLGKILATEKNIDIQSYLLSKAPAMGGLDTNKLMDNNDSPAIITQEQLSKSISDLEIELDLQQQRYDIMKTVNVSAKSTLSKSSSSKKVRNTKISNFFDYTNPVSKGYISSAYGKRRDPINGHQRHHNGIDIAAKHGSRIQTIASGFVTFSGRKGGYGNVIDIHHSDSLKSRYAHLDTIKVKKGEVVRKGETIATMGKTGRATGSHLHLEVWKNNRPVNPESYINTALIK